MRNLYSVTMSICGYEGVEPSVTAFWSVTTEEKTLHGDFRLELETPAVPEDFAQWLRDQLVQVVEGL